MKTVSLSNRLIIIFATCFSTSVSAGWTGGLEAGTRLGSSNSPALRFYASKQSIPVSHYLYLDWGHVSGGSRYRLAYDPVYSISQSFYSFGRFSIEQDDPGEVGRDLGAAAGLGNSFFRTRNSRMAMEAGIGARQLHTADGDDTDGFIFLSGLFQSKLLTLLRLDITADVRGGESQVTFDAEAGLSFRIGPNTALKYAFRYQRYDLDDNQDAFVEKDNYFTLAYGF